TSSWELEVLVTDASGLTDTATITIDIDDLTENTLGGHLFNDVDADGYVAHDGLEFEAATVHLYLDANGDGLFDNSDLLIRTTTTDNSGHYYFNGIGDFTHFVVVDSTTLAPHQGYNTGTSQADVWAEQTYGSTGSLVTDTGVDSYTTTSGALFGGRTATGSDDLADASTAEHVTRVSMSGADNYEVDFGFSFNVVTNLEGGDVAATSGHTVQGSLRQFMINANSIVGDNTMRFVPVVDHNELVRETWQLVVTELLPELTDAGTTIDGQAYSFRDGLNMVDLNADEIGTPGTLVGVNEYALDLIDRPELELVAGATLQYGLMVKADNTTVSGLRVDGFGDGTILDGGVQLIDADDFVLQYSHLVNAAGANLAVDGGLGGLVQHNLIEGGDAFGIFMDGNGGQTNDDWLITDNFIMNNADQFAYGDGIDVEGNSNVTIRHNLFSGNAGSGVDSYQNTGVLIVDENTVVGNGYGGSETSGIRLFGSNHEVTSNVVQDNAGAGVYAVGGGAASPGPALHNLISMNEFGGNDGIAIDLGEQAATALELNRGDGVSDFSVFSPDYAQEGIQNPVLNSSVLDAGSTEIRGMAGPNQRIEFYAAVADTDSSDTSGGENYGEGIKYLGWTMSNAIGEFTFLTNDLLVDDAVTAIAIDSNNNTSEFSQNIEVNVAPVADGFDLDLDPGESWTFDLNDFSYSDVDGDTFASIEITQLPVEGELQWRGSAVTLGQVISASDIDDGDLEYIAPTDAAGDPVDTIKFTVFDGTLSSLEHDIEVSVENDAPLFVTGSDVNLDENVDSLTIVATDPEGFDVTYDLGTGNDEGLFSIHPTSGELTFAMTPDFENPHDGNTDNQYVVEVVVTDPAGNETTKEITIHVQPVNDNVPVWDGPASYDVDENETAVTTLAVDDDDLPGDDIVFGIEASSPDFSLFQINPATGELSFIDPPDYESAGDVGGDNVYNLRVSASDGDNTIYQDITVSVQPVNEHAQVITNSSSHSIDENTTFVVDLETSDNDDPQEPISWSIDNGWNDGDLFTINPSTGELTFDVAPNFESPLDGDGNNEYLVRVVSDDGDGNVVTKDLAITVRDVNEPIADMELKPDHIDEMSPGGSTVGFVLVDDRDAGETHLWELLDDAGDIFDINPATGELTVQPGADLNYEDQTSYEIVVQVTDSELHQLTETLTVYIDDVNEVAVATDKLFNVDEGAAVHVKNSEFNDIVDPDGDPLAISIASGPAHGTAKVLADNSIVYTHHGSETTLDSFVYRINDGRGGIDTAVITITINPVNDAPIAIGESIIASGEGSFVIAEGALLANDTDAEMTPLDVVVVSGPANGTLTTLPNGSLRFTPDENTLPIETFTYHVTDGDKDSNVVTASIVTTGITRIELPEREPDPVDPPIDPGTPIDPGEPTSEENEPGGNNEPGSPGDLGVDSRLANTRANDQNSFELSDTSALTDSELLTANYGFTYQKSSVDLSSLWLQEQTASYGSFDGSASGISTEMYTSLWHDLDMVNHEILDNINAATGNIAAAASLTGVLTVGYVLWMARGGMLVASLVSSMPAWQSFDPLPILQYSAGDDDADAEDDSIEALLDRAGE
ncbi:MAG: Ig-like domain-containing protein, partial [Pirellulaceae bacterium]